MKRRKLLKYCLKLYSYQRPYELASFFENSPLAKRISAVRIIEHCSEHFASQEHLSNFIGELIGTSIKNNVFVLQYEVPPLFVEDFNRFIENLRRLANTSNLLNSSLIIVANDYGVLKACSDNGIPVIVGRAFNKSHLRLPAAQRFYPGRWLTLDAVTQYLPSGPPSLPYLNEYSLRYLSSKGVIGIDIDAETDVISEAIKEIKGQFLLYIHADDIFMAAGRHCFIKGIYGKCEPNKCYIPSFYFHFQKDMERDCSFSYYDTKFYFRGKTVYRKTELTIEQLTSTVPPDRICVLQPYEQIPKTDIPVC